MITIVTRAVREHYGQNRLATFIVNILHIVLTAGLIECRGDFFEQRTGLPTGRSCSSTIANIYLSSGFDLHVRDALQLDYLARYIDDGFGMISKTKTRAEVLHVLNSWPLQHQGPERRPGVVGIGACAGSRCLP